MKRFRQLWTWLTRLADDALPMALDEREERDWSGETSAEEAERRQEQLRLKTREKEGKGGFR